MVPLIRCAVVAVLLGMIVLLPSTAAGQERQLPLHTQIDEGRVGLMRVDAAIRMIEREKWSSWRFNSAMQRSVDTLRTLDPAMVVEVAKPVIRCEPASTTCQTVMFQVRDCNGAPPGAPFSVREYEPYCYARAVAAGRAAPAQRREVPATCPAADSLFGPISRAQRALDLELEYRGDGRLQTVRTGREVILRTGIALFASMPIFTDQTLPRLSLNVPVAVREMERHLEHADSAFLIIDAEPARPLGVVAVPQIPSPERFATRPVMLQLPFDDLTRLATADRAVIEFHNIRTRLQRDDLNSMNAIARRVACAPAAPED